MRILLVDDDPQTLDVLDFAMMLDGHETLRAVDGREALTKARTAHPDVIVLDQMMPVMDGLEAARRLRADATTRSIPVVMLTARATDADVWAGYQAGVASYVTKPLDLDVLQGEIDRLLAPNPLEVVA